MSATFTDTIFESTGSDLVHFVVEARSWTVSRAQSDGK